MSHRSPRETGADKLGKRLREIRASRKLTQAQLAERVGIDRSMVGNYESGLHYPPIPTLVKLADALETSVDRLLGLEQKHSEDIQDRRLYRLFLRADQADYLKQGLIKQLLENLLESEAPAKKRTGTNG